MSVETSGSSEYWRIPSSASGRLLPRGSLVHLVDARLTADPHDQVDDRPGRDRRADRHAVDLSLQLGDDQPDRARGAGRGRDEVDRRRPCSPQILVRQVEDALVVRVRVDRRHEALLDREGVVEHLRERRDAVRRAGRVGDDPVRVAVIRVVVDAEHDRDVGVGRGRGDDDLRRTGVEVQLRLVALGEEAGRLEHHVDAEFPPGQVLRVALGQNLELLACGGDRPVAGAGPALEPAEHGVVLEQVRHRRGVRKVVDRNDVDVGTLPHLGAKEVPPDPPKPVDPNLDRQAPLLASKYRARS